MGLSASPNWWNQSTKFITFGISSWTALMRKGKRNKKGVEAKCEGWIQIRIASFDHPGTDLPIPNHVKPLSPFKDTRLDTKVSGYSKQLPGQLWGNSSNFAVPMFAPVTLTPRLSDKAYCNLDLLEGEHSLRQE
jgi:hypothetical protein